MKSEKFLQFNGKEIVFVQIQNVYWIVLKPICEALNIDYIRSFKNAKNDEILGSVLSEQTIQVEKNGKKQGRKMTCIPEEFIYGWLFSLRSDSKELTEYKRICYRLLYNHFHGTITNRKELLMQRREIDNQLAELQEELNVENEKYKKVKELLEKKKKLNSLLGAMDKELIKQPELFPE